MGWGSKKTTTSTATNSALGTSTPLLNPLAQQFYQNTLFPGAQSLIAIANKPVYGDAHKADVLNNLNDLANAASAHLKSSLSGRGQLGSGEFETGLGNIEQQRYGQLSNFYSNLPALEDQAHQQRMAQALGLGAGLAAQLPVGQISNQSSTSNGVQTEKDSTGLGAIVGALAGGVGSSLMGGVMGGFGSLAQGGSFGQGFGNALNPYGAMPAMPGQYINPQGGLGSGSLPMPPQQIPWTDVSQYFQVPTRPPQ